MKIKVVLAVVLLSVLASCGNENVPRPTGYFRIDLPAKEYRTVDDIPFSFQFELPQYAHPNLERTKKDSNLFNIDFAKYNARIHMSYIKVDSNINQLSEEARSLVYKHVVKAQDIREELIINPEEKVYGTFYHIEGNAASGSQFYLTDSSRHFVRGALYFNVEPNYDSIAPVQQFIKADIERMIESFKWAGD